MKTIRITFLLLLGWSAANAGLDSLYAVVHGDTVTIWNKNVDSNCGSKYDFLVTIGRDTVTVVERDTSTERMRCNCLFNLSVSVTNLDSGKHVAMVYRQLLKMYGYPSDTMYLVGSVEFTLSKVSILPYYSYLGYQSNCLSVPVGVARKELSQPEVGGLSIHPNPFNPTTNFRFTIPDVRRVTLAVYDVLGREVALLVDAYLPTGEHVVRWDAGVFPSGIYFYRLSAGEDLRTGRISLVR